MFRSLNDAVNLRDAQVERTLVLLNLRAVHASDVRKTNVAVNAILDTCHKPLAVFSHLCEGP